MLHLLAITCTLLVTTFDTGVSLRFGAGFADVQVQSLVHGDQTNPNQNGTCREFLRLNSLNACCANRRDECYMYHFDTRCYCDNFCERPQSDCCHDAMSTCLGIEELVQVQSQGKQFGQFVARRIDFYMISNWRSLRKKRCLLPRLGQSSRQLQWMVTNNEKIKLI